MIGAVRGIDAETGHYFDDTRRYIDALNIPALQKQQVFELNARRVFPRLDTLLRAQGR
jgi:4-oxalmesaconate hydratase